MKKRNEVSESIGESEEMNGRERKREE